MRPDLGMPTCYPPCNLHTACLKCTKRPQIHSNPYSSVGEIPLLFCYFCDCLALFFCLSLAVAHTAVRCSLNTFRPCSSSSSLEEAVAKKWLFFRDSSHQITATAVVNSTRPDPPSTGFHCLKLKVLFECMSACTSAYLYTCLVCVTTLDQRRHSKGTEGSSGGHLAKTLFYFEIKIDCSESLTYNTKPLQ